MDQMFQLVQSLYAAFARGNIKSIVAACDPDILWISNVDPVHYFPSAGSAGGLKSRVGSLLPELTENLLFNSYRPRELFAGPDFVAVFGRSISHSMVTGDPFEDDWMHLFKIRNAKVIEFRVFNDTHALVQAHFGGDIHSVTVERDRAVPAQKSPGK